MWSFWQHFYFSTFTLELPVLMQLECEVLKYCCWQWHHGVFFFPKPKTSYLTWLTPMIMIIIMEWIYIAHMDAAPGQGGDSSCKHQHHCLNNFFPRTCPCRPLCIGIMWNSVLPYILISGELPLYQPCSCSFFMINRATELTLILFPTNLVAVSDCSSLFKFLQMIKRNINNVRRMTSHPTLPYCESDSLLFEDLTSHFLSAA